MPSDRLGRRDAIATPARLDHGLWWVFFRDKGVSTEAGLRAQLAALRLHPRTSARRLRTATSPDAYDLPVTPDHILSVAATGAQLRVVSRWLNAVSVRATAGQLQALGRLPAVAGMLPVARGKRHDPEATAATAGHAADRTQFSLSYGPSLQQNLPLQIPEMHALGVTGTDILIAILDSGFRLTHNALAGIASSGRVIDQWDFVHGDSSVADDSLDTPGQERHGSQVLSTAAGFQSGALIGPAYRASFLLAKTEDIGSETPIEEDNYVAALEWADSLGADILTSSLTYDFGYVMDGTEGISTLAANTAVSRGILLVTSMGNSGPGPTSMGAPADAFDILSVGAVDVAGQIAFFSSRGPTADGRTKPEVVAQGVAVHMVDPGTADGYTSANGTSFSAPLTSGSAALLLQAHADWSPTMLREAMILSGDRSQAPDDAYGWGRFDLLRAVEHAPLGALRLQLDAFDRYDAADWDITVTATAFFTRQPEQLTVHYQYVPGGITDSAVMSLIGSDNVVSEWTAAIPYTGEQGLRFFVRSTDSSGRVAVRPSPAARRFELLRQPDSLVEGYEYGGTRWVRGGTPVLWWPSAADASEGQFALTDSPAGPYPDSADAWIETGHAIFITSAATWRYSFASRHQLAMGDTGWVEWQRTGGGSWLVLDTLTGEQAAWTTRSYDLPMLAGDAVKLRFRLKSDAGGAGDGVTIDDLRLGPILTAVTEPAPRPATWSLGPNYPNPFNAGTAIPIELNVPTMVRLVIYSVAGRRIRVLHDHVLPAGTHTLHWDGTDQDGRSVASGVYFYRLESPAQTRTRKLVLLR